MHPHWPAGTAETGHAAHGTHVTVSRAALFQRVRLSQRPMALISVVTAGTVLAACGGSATPTAAHHRHPSVAVTPAASPTAAALPGSRVCQRFQAASQTIARQVPAGRVTKADQRFFISYGQGLIRLGALLTRERPSPDPKVAHDLKMAGRAVIVFAGAFTSARDTGANKPVMRWLTAVATDCAMLSAAGAG